MFPGGQRVLATMPRKLRPGPGLRLCGLVVAWGLGDVDAGASALDGKHGFGFFLGRLEKVCVDGPEQELHASEHD